MNRRYLLSNIIKPTEDYGNMGEIYITGDATVKYDKDNKGMGNYFITNITPNANDVSNLTKYEFSKTDESGNVVKNTTTLSINRFSDLFETVEDSKTVSISTNYIDMNSVDGTLYFPVDDFLSAAIPAPITSFNFSSYPGLSSVIPDSEWNDRDEIVLNAGSLKGLKVHPNALSYSAYIKSFKCYCADMITYYGIGCFKLADSVLTYEGSKNNYASTNDCFLDGDIYSQEYENDETARIFWLENSLCITSCNTSTDLNQTVSLSLDETHTPLYYNGTEWAALSSAVSSLNYSISPVFTEGNSTYLKINTTCPMRLNDEYGIYFIPNSENKITKIEFALPTVDESWDDSQLTSATANLYIILCVIHKDYTESKFIIDPSRISTATISSAHIMNQIYGCQCDVLTLALSSIIDCDVLTIDNVTGYVYWVKDASIFPNVDEESAQANIEKVTAFYSDQFESFTDINGNNVIHSGRFAIFDDFYTN